MTRIEAVIGNGPYPELTWTDLWADAAQRLGSSDEAIDHLQSAIKAIKTLRCGMVNVNEIPGFRVENSPFGGIKDSGLGVKEGVIEAMKAYSFVKTFSLPW